MMLLNVAVPAAAPEVIGGARVERLVAIGALLLPDGTRFL